MKDRFVFRKPNSESQFEEYLGEYLTIVPIVYQTSAVVTTDAMVYFVEQDGSVGVANRIDVYIKDSAKNYYPSYDVEEEIIPSLEEET